MSVMKCCVCNKSASKYTCPQCDLRTCSLQCVKIHKQELNCKGIREKTNYLPVSKFDNITLLNDYRFLEEINRNIDNCRRNPQKRYTRYMQPLPTHLYRLKSALGRRKIHLQFLPQHFTRHQENRTLLNYTTQIVQWKVDFIFPQANMIKISEVVDENEKVLKVLDRYLNYLTCPEVYKEDLRFYIASGISDVELLLKAERVKEPNSFHIVDKSLSFNENLMHKVIIENPIFYVIRKAHKNEYNIIEETDSITTNPFEVVHGKKSGFFGDFSPVKCFDDLFKVQKVESAGNKALSTIQQCAAELLGHELNEEEPTPLENHCNNYSYPKKLDIPDYDSLCN